MDVNDTNNDHDDTIGSPDDVGFSNFEDQLGNFEDQLGEGADTAEKADGNEGYDPAVWSAPPKKDPKTGRFIAGTGSSLKGGRPKGSKDRVSKAMVDLATDLVRDRGSELFNVMADRDPAQALALVAKIISPEELRAVYAEDRVETEVRDHTININLVGGTSLPRPENAIEAPVQRIKHTPDDLSTVISEGAYMATEEPVERAPEPSVQDAQEKADRLAVERERERVAMQNETIKRHGGQTGRQRRGGSGHWQDGHVEDVL